RFIAQLKQKYTQSNGRRPFGISALIAGFDDDGTPRLFQTDPSGVYHEWKANATGKSGKTVKEYLEKNYSAEYAANDDLTIKLAIKALLEVVQGKNLEVAVMRRNQKLKILDDEELTRYITEIEKEKEEEAEKKKQKKK
ncbi:proteasome subunit alpha type-7-like isoform 2, partial [Leptotrombidium deliense]